MTAQKRRRWLKHPLVVMTAALGLLSLAGTGVAGAQGGGGTSKPPKGAVSPWVIPTLPSPALGATAAAALHGFDSTGIIQSASVDAGCGGTVKLNGQTVQIPCNLIVQMPANTLTWADFVNGGPTAGLELRVVGNMVSGGRKVAGLAYASQQSTNTGNGVITGFDYATGTLLVDDSNGSTVRVQLNDPKIDSIATGRFSAGQSPDARFSVDQDNPTVHAATGYPMCIPRTDPSSAVDPLCPQSNRPLAAAGCRNFSQAGIVPPAAGDLGGPAVGQIYCSQYVMPAVGSGLPGGDPRQQAPFEVGDYVDFSGTLYGSGSSAYISAHTVEANVGIYTQPKTQPAYVAIGEFGVGTADPLANAVNGAPQETQDRIFLEAETTDVQTPVDIYYVDKDSAIGVRNRWITPFEMTGENQALAGGASGGITTQYTGAQPQRARLRATKAPTGLLSQPSRNVRVAQRSLCVPTPLGTTGTTIDNGALDKCFSDDASPLKTVANGLAAGQYSAPTFEYIFPENVKPGDVLVPNDLWHLPFLVHGEVDANGVVTTGKLAPTPW